MASGGPVRRGVGIYEASIYDIAPTVLHLLGLPLAESLRGRVLADALDPDWLERNPPRRTPRYDVPAVLLPDAPGAPAARSRVDRRLREELRAIGYLE